MENKKKSYGEYSSSQRDNNFKKKTYSTSSSRKNEYGNTSERPKYSNDYQKKNSDKFSERPANRTKYSENYTKKESDSQSYSSTNRYKSDNFKKNNTENRVSSEKTTKKDYKKPYNPEYKKTNDYKKPYNSEYKKTNDYKKPFVKKHYEQPQSETPKQGSSEVRLNKFIADAGICSRRNADVYITAGNVEVNGVVMTTLGYRVKPSDIVKFDGKILSSEKKEYILLNKPKGFITTTSDEKGRKTVMDLVANATTSRILPVGRLDRQTMGLLLLTNDGDLAKKLTHPTHGVRKIYHVILDKKLDYKDFIKIEEGFDLEDGFIQVDEISYINDAPKNEIGVKIHSGRNRIVRRIFEHLGYQIEKLDRVVFAGLTKKDLPRGHWRRLTQQEIINLRNIK